MASINSPLRRRTTCRLCDSRALELAVPLAASPIADAFVPKARVGQPQACYPLDLYLCSECGHVQNLDVVDPAELFRDYLFTTGSSGGLVGHFRNYAEALVQRFSIAPDRLVVEVGSNDGTLLGFFKGHGLRALGIDPAREIARQATGNGIETLPDFFGSSLARQIRRERGGAALVCANNVFAHSDDLADIAQGVREVLADDGVFVFEVSYLVDIVDGLLFDTVYHEHVSYHSVAPLDRFLKRHGLELFDVERIASKGGSIRGFAQRRPEGRRSISPIVGDLMALEKRRGFDRAGIYTDFSARINGHKAALAGFVDAERAQGRTFVGYGASTTTTTLMWQFDLTKKLAFVADDNSKKHGLFTPGCHLPVVASEELYSQRPDVVVILAWQYATQIISKHARYLASGGRFAVPLPELKIVGG